MGKLTGPSNKPSEPGPNNDKPSGKNGNINRDEAAAIESAESTDTPQSNGKVSENGSSSNRNDDLRISLNSRRNAQNSNNRRSLNKNSEFSNSMIRAVNNAAETARLVLDNASACDIVADDSRSVSSHGSRQSFGSSNSIHSYTSRRSSKPGSVNGMSLGADIDDDAEITEMLSLGDDIGNTGNDIEDPDSEESNTLLYSETSCTGPPPFSPPPNAFQNLPMTRGFTPTHKTSGGRTVGEISSNDDLLADGKVYEVTNHFDAAAAISAALAGSHFAQASGSFGEMQKNHGSPGSDYFPASKRRSTKGEEGGTFKLTSPVRRANSGGTMEEIYSLLVRTNSEENTNQINNSYRPRRRSGSALESLKKGSSEEQDDNPRRRSAGLPTPEEAQAEMLTNRTSFVSVDDLSFGSNDEQIKMLMGKLKESRKPDSIDVKDGNQINSNNEKNDQTCEKGEEAVNQAKKSSLNRKEETDERSNLVKVTGNMIKVKSDDSASQCSSSGYENESNTSSVAYGSNTSDISPISMSTGDDSIIKQNGGNNSGKMGMLGNLANSRRAANLEETNHSYEGADDEYSTNSEISGGRGKQHPPRARRGGDGDVQDKKGKSVTVCPKSIPVVPKGNIHGLMFDGMGSANLQMDKFNTSSTAKDNDFVDAASPEGNLLQLPKQSPVEQHASHAAPPHHASLFDSFDKNWEQAVHRGSGNNAEKVLALGPKCFAAFVAVFQTACTDADGHSIFGNSIYNSNGDIEENSHAWWVDDNALTNVGDIVRRQPLAKDGNVGASLAAVAGVQEDNDQGIPIVVVRSLWRACCFEVDDDGNDDDVEGILDSIEHTLTNELCYLTINKALSAVKCMRLSLDIYAEYGWYILRRFELQDQVAGWHSKFADVLRGLLLDGSLNDTDSMIKRRYAAQSLPRHTAIGLLRVDSNGRFQKDVTTEEKQTAMFNRLFDDLLCDQTFIKARSELLGRGINRPNRDADDMMLNENVDGDGANAQIAEMIEQDRDNDHNMLISSTAHMRDIEWCALFCSHEDKGVDETSSAVPQNEKKESSHQHTSTFSFCIDAMARWKEELISSYSLLLNGEKLTICQSTSGEELKASASTDSGDKSESLLAAKHLSQLLYLHSDSYESDNSPPGTGKSCIQVVKSLLAKEDAWTMKDDSAKIFQSSSSKKCKKDSFSSPRPPRKGWRKRGGGAEKKEASTTAAISTTSPLARILEINTNNLRMAISIGRSLLSLAEFSQYMIEKNIFHKESKELAKTSVIKTRLHEMQSSCLKNAIEVLSSTAITLGYILSSPLEKLDEDDLDETVATSTLGPTALLRMFAMTREASKPLLSLAGILSADAWFNLGKLIGKEPGKKSDANDLHVMLFSFERALLILNSPKSISLNKPALDLLCESLLSPLTQYKCFLQANINHSVGVFAYEQGDNERAEEYLDKSSRFRRQMLDDLRGQVGENVASNGNDLSKLFNAVVGGMKSNYLVSPASMSEEVFENIFRYSITHTCIQLPIRKAFATNELELSLSLTLEYSALTQHAGQKYQMALSLFQESLILRTMHVGKHSLDVASLHFNMGVVYDDLEQYDQAISRYHESLRIRLDHFNKASSPTVISELDDSVLLTLKCMGHVYKIINELDNAICCYVKALEMVNKKFQTYRDPVDEWEMMGLRLGLAVPVPTIIFDEMKSTSGNSSCKTHFQMMNKKELCHVFEPRLTKRRGRSTVSKLKKELTKIHSMVIELIQERKKNTWDNESGSARSRASLSLLLASLSSTFKTGGDAFESALMRSSFSLGRMRLEQTRYEEAADHLETALRSKWVLDPASSSDSDSDFSRKSLSRKQPKKCMDEDDPEEGQIYYALGICNAALDDHERAVRCFLTALRYLRRSLRKVDSLEVARVLFDCATSYYYICNFEQAVSLFGECLRILSSHHGSPSKNDSDDKKSPVNDDHISKGNRFRRGIVLYCLVMARAAIEFDSTASNLLHEAQNLLSSCNDKIILAYMEFMTGLFLHHAASHVPIRLRSIAKITPTGLSLIDGLSWNEMCESALSLLEQVKNEAWFDPIEGVEDSDEVKHLPLSGHICFKEGQLYELLGRVDQALNHFVDAANFYRIACGDENMYVASVLHHMGMICSLRTEYHALGYFNEALSIRKNLLGGNDHLVAETLYASAVVLARLNRYEASMERYHEALRIQMADSQDSNEVARTLAGMGICHYNHAAYDLSLTCLEGAVKIRKYRVSRLTDSDEIVELYGEEVALGTDFFNLGNVHMQLGDYAQAMQCFIQSRDLRWRHVGGGTVDKILDKYFSERTVDEDELLGLAHCLHNIGVMFDIKKEYQRSLPHYEEALAIKNAIAGFSERDSMLLVDQVNPDENRVLVLQSLHKDHEFPRINKATLSASVTRQKIAAAYVKQRKYDHALFHFSHALRIQRQVLGKDHFRVGSILSNMGNALRRTSSHSETAIICYNESLRISRLRFGQNHTTVASTMFDIGRLYDANKNFSKAMHYYQRALSVYKQKYSQQLRQRLCSGLERPRGLMNDDEEGTEILSTGDEINVACDAPAPEKQLRDQYALVTEALKKAKHQDIINRGERISCIGDSDDAWLNFETLLFRFVEMLSTYIIDPANTVVKDAIDSSRRRIESAAAHAVITTADALDYQFLLLLQE